MKISICYMVEKDFQVSEKFRAYQWKMDQEDFSCDVKQISSMDYFFTINKIFQSLLIFHAFCIQFMHKYNCLHAPPVLNRVAHIALLVRQQSMTRCSSVQLEIYDKIVNALIFKCLTTLSLLRDKTLMLGSVHIVFLECLFFHHDVFVLTICP